MHRRRFDRPFSTARFTIPSVPIRLLDEIAAGRIKPAQIDINHFNRLLQHRDKAVQARAKAAVRRVHPARSPEGAGQLQTCSSHARQCDSRPQIFAKQCATCHRIGDVGVNVAPDISDSREKTTEQLLTDILQPNRAIDANYFSYNITTTRRRHAYWHPYRRNVHLLHAQRPRARRLPSAATRSTSLRPAAFR